MRIGFALLIIFYCGNAAAQFRVRENLKQGGLDNNHPRHQLEDKKDSTKGKVKEREPASEKTDIKR